jgi:hypothetical protein
MDSVGFPVKIPEKIQEISVPGKVSIGFAYSMNSMLPTIMNCLAYIQTKMSQPPRHRPIQAPKGIHVVGHSLGAALAVHFTSAVILGNTYRHDLQGTQMPAAIRPWPWDHAGRADLNLATFALPANGNSKFSQALCTKVWGTMFGLEGDVVLTRTLAGLQTEDRFDIKALIKADKSMKSLVKDGKTAAPDLHQPYNIRSVLIHCLVEREFELNQLLTGADAKKPWWVYDTFPDLLKAVSLSRPDINEVSKLLGPNFCGRLEHYLLEVRDVALPARQAGVDILRTAVMQIGARAPGGAQRPWDAVVINQVGLGWNYIYSQYADKIISDPFKKFLGMCLFLGAASMSTVSDALTQSKSMDFFKDLPFT